MNTALRTGKRIQDYIAGFMGKGFSHSDASEMALRAVEGTINKQSMLMGFTDAYQYLGIAYAVLYSVCVITGL